MRSDGSVLSAAIKAANMLAEEDIKVDVINARFAAPIDTKISSLLGQGKGIITVEDHSVACGFGSAVLESAAIVSGGRIAGPVEVLGAGREFIKHDLRKRQLAEIGVTADKIAARAKKMANSL